MSLASLRADVAECRAWERRLHAGSPSMRSSAALPGRGEWLLPLAMPLSAAAAWRFDWSFDNHFWFLVIPWWWLLSFGRIDPPAVPGEWEALRLPSRRSWLLARWSLRALPLLWLGACTAAWLFFWLLRADENGELPAAPLMGAVLLAPFLAVALISWSRVQSACFGGRHVSLPLAMQGLGVLAAVASAILLGVSGFDESGGGFEVFAGVFSILGGFLWLLSLPSLLGIARIAGGGRALGGASRTFRLVAVEAIGIAPLVGLVVLAFWLKGESRAGWTLPPALAATIVAVATPIAAFVVAAHALRCLPAAEIGLVPARSKPAFSPAERVAIPSRFAGGSGPRSTGLVAAAWALYRGRWRAIQHPILTFVPKLLWECRTPACGFVAMVAPCMLIEESGPWTMFGALWLTAVSLALVENPLRVPASRRLHLLGVDFAAVARHNLVTGSWLAVLPALAGAALFPAILREPPEAGVIVGALLFTAGALLLRQGGAGSSLLVRILPGGRGGWARAAAVLVAFAAAWILDRGLFVLLGGLAVFLFALVAVGIDLRRPEEAGRRLEEAAEDG